MSHILLTNDDGIDAPGLAALRRGLDPLGTVLTLAPDGNRSAIARSITIDRPLHARETRFGDGFSGYSLDGTPADCVRAAALGFFGERPEIVVAGANMGANLGDDVAYSGTVAAALEGALLGLPAVAVSVQGRSPRHFDDAGHPGGADRRARAGRRPAARPRAQRQRARPGGRRGARRAGHQPGLRQRPRTHRARDRRRHGQALHDPQRGARLPARDRHRFRGARRRVHLHHAAALRSGRPARVRAARGLEAQRGRGGRAAGGRRGARRDGRRPGPRPAGAGDGDGDDGDDGDDEENSG